MATVILFAQAREAAGTATVETSAGTVAGVVDDLGSRFGPALAEVLAVSMIWCNGESVDAGAAVAPDDEVAVLPPVSGG